MKPIALIALIAFVACGGTARAADTCLSLPQARAAHPNKYLMYHLDDGRRCWTSTRQRGASVRHRETLQTPRPVPAPRSTVLWPSLASLAVPVDAALLTPEAATRWPRLLDVDEITGPVAELPECCWPPLDEPEPPFSDRWFALPSNWFAAVTQ